MVSFYSNNQKKLQTVERAKPYTINKMSRTVSQSTVSNSQSLNIPTKNSRTTTQPKKLKSMTKKELISLNKQLIKTNERLAKLLEKTAEKHQPYIDYIYELYEYLDALPYRTKLQQSDFEQLDILIKTYH